MTKEQRDWITEAIDFCARAKEKGVLLVLSRDESATGDDGGYPGHEAVVTNATTPAQICWLGRVMNGEEYGSPEPEGE